jgi:hypothetical protein
MLSCYKDYLPKTFYIPDYLISVRNRIVGFTIPKFNGFVLTDILNDKNVSIGEKKFYLKEVGGVLEQLKNIRTYTPLKDFYLNDLHESNFLVNPLNKELAVVDLDSSRIMGNMPSPSRFLTSSSIANLVPEKYVISEKCGFLDCMEASEDTDLFCFSIMILNYLYGGNVSSFSIENFYNYLTYLRDLGVNQELIDLFNNLIVNTENKNPTYYIDSLSEEQIRRANKTVYERVRKK